MHHATALLYHVCAVASHNIRLASCGTSGNLLCGRATYYGDDYMDYFVGFEVLTSKVCKLPSSGTTWHYIPENGNFHRLFSFLVCYHVEQAASIDRGGTHLQVSKYLLDYMESHLRRQKLSTDV
jgi:hypothetical protein